MLWQVFSVQMANSRRFMQCWIRMVALVTRAQFTVFLAELRKHVRLLAFIVAFAAVLLPQQGQGNAMLCQLTVNVRIVRFNVQASTLVLVWEEHPLQVCVGDVIVKGPLDSFLSSYLQNSTNSVLNFELCVDFAPINEA